MKIGGLLALTGTFVYAELGGLFPRTGGFQAETHLLEGYATLEAALIRGHPRTKRALRRLIELYSQWDKPEKAEAYRLLLDPEKESDE